MKHNYLITPSSPILQSASHVYSYEKNSERWLTCLVFLLLLFNLIVLWVSLVWMGPFYSELLVCGVCHDLSFIPVGHQTSFWRVWPWASVRYVNSGWRREDRWCSKSALCVSTAKRFLMLNFEHACASIHKCLHTLLLYVSWNSSLLLSFKSNCHMKQALGLCISFHGCIWIRKWKSKIWFFCLYSSLTGSSVPDLIVSMSNQMWLHLQSDDTIGSQGFKAVYEGMPL